MPAIELNLSERVQWVLEVEHPQVNRFEPSAQPCDDLPAAVGEALGQPLDFPAFDQAVVAGDRLVLAVEACLPQIDTLVPTIVGWFVERGTSDDHIRIVVAGVGKSEARSVRERMERALDTGKGLRTEVEIHDVDNGSQIAYVAANEQAEPIYVNRAMIDADVVLPVLCTRSESAVDNFGGFGLYPLVSDRDTRGAFYRLQNAAPERLNASMARRADQAAWWSGMHMAIQVVPALNNRISEVVAGSFAAAADRARQRMAAGWTARMRPADLTIATLDAHRHQQDWMAVARALHAASRVTVEGGSIVLCSQAAPPAGAACRVLSQGRAGNRDVQKQLSRQSSDDALAVELLDRIARSKHLYFVSDWPIELVEGLGACPIDEVEALKHLCEKSAAVNILPSAQHCHALAIDPAH